MKFIILGLIQGLTEFFPVSSSGHLVIAEKLLGFSQDQLFWVLVCHMGTLLAIVIFFFRDILGFFRKPGLLGHILVVTVVTAVIALACKDFFESLFVSTRALSVSFFITGVILLFAGRFQSGKRSINSIDIRDSLFLGFMQAVAIVPGISRSGMTISALLFRGIDKEAAFKFSFLAGIPAIAGAFLLEIKDAGKAVVCDWTGLILAFIASFLSGLFALAVLRSILNKARFHWFGYYCIVMAVLTAVFLK
ncbi:MAG: undecaprenyl-diphosphate phosphatase [Candidatus Omnitrophica bacterium]|nr:undecaprenyl-diphosphate phosphatase [Candidatus Omnitrophota bacterium]MDD5655612.1 undecaprenyl-diphosphate phosphatase [Candidatus Omnitrophota bacterium]